MYQNTLLVMDGESQAAIAQATQALTAAGLQVVRSFDLQVARSLHVGCACPHHGTDQCNCQMVVLLIYGSNKPPLTLVAHGHDGQTHFALVDSPSQRPDTGIVADILQLLIISRHSKPIIDGKSQIK
jgi:hypothetical protein